MGKNRILDIAHKKGMNEGYIISSFKQKGIYLILLLIIYCLILMGCSLPRIVILDDPLTPEEHINLGLAYENKGLIDNAIEEYKKASSKIPIAYLYLGNIYMKKGDMDEAERNYRVAIKRQSDIADAYNNLAWLYYLKKENLKEAQGLASRAVELEPDNETYKDTLYRINELLHGEN